MWFGVKVREARLRCLADVEGMDRVYTGQKVNMELPGRRGEKEDVSEGSWM